MGEIFRREAAKRAEPFTGKRLTADIGGQVEIEHYHRYLFPRSLVRGPDVLDVASGEGYGSALLAQVARSVIGIEYSEATVRNAAANFPRPNLRYLRGDARSLPLASACVDTIVSFETIEHFDQQQVFLDESLPCARAQPARIQQFAANSLLLCCPLAAAFMHWFGAVCRVCLCCTTAGF